MSLKQMIVIALVTLIPANCGKFESQVGVFSLLLLSQLDSSTSSSVNISHTGGNGMLAEGGATDTYTIYLGKKPSSDITIQATPDSQVLINSSSSPLDLTFTASNWNIPRTVTVTAVDDTIPEGDHTSVISHVVTSGDAAYLALSLNDLIFSITDNDYSSATITQSGGSTSIIEGVASAYVPATDTYTIVLDTAPTSNVTITITADSQVSADQSTLVFTPSDWNIPQTVTVSAVDDSIVEGYHTATITHSVTSSDQSFDGITVGNVTVAVYDNDTDSLGRKRIFVTDTTVQGDFGGIAAADAICNSDTAMPTGDTYKAMLSDGATREASPAFNWILAANTDYYQADGATLIGITNGSGVFAFNLNNAFSTGGSYYWSGFTTTWSSSANLCYNGASPWSSNTSSNGRPGDSSSVDSTSIRVGTISCSNSYSLLCVAQ